MSATITGRTRPTKPKKQARAQKRKRDDVDVDKLTAAVDKLDPAAPIERFTDLPLSEPTKAGLKAAHFSTLTDIQKRAIPAALLGRDILGAARTGSGKTLAFLIPVLENLYRAQCVGQDAGLGAMIISPTRELAIQIFDVLRTIGKQGHLFSAGLIIGGKGLKDEQEALARMNIVVCTPGRILQHLSETASFAFSVDQLRMLVLDEADRIMDLGFQKAVDAIVDYLPPDRQTLLFSATQTKRVSDLARLSLRDPEYIDVHESAEFATPASLQQNYTITALPQKLDTLWSFLQSAKKVKTLVFLSSGKQVRYVFEAFRKLQPGVPLMHLHGRQKQFARLEVTSRFSTSKAAVLFATDVAARGLDFPAVDWVVQMDCPEDADTYIHRVGRTARYQRGGRAVLFLDPAEEEGMLSRLANARVPIERINVRQAKMAQGGIAHQLANLCFKDPALKYLGQKAFSSYIRSLHIMKDKEIFSFDRYGENISKLAESMGLPGAPRIRYTAGDAEAMKARKNAPRRGMTPSASEDEDEGEGEGIEDGDVQAPAKGANKTAPAVRTKYDRMFGRTNQDVLAPHYSSMLEPGANSTVGTAASPNESDDDEDDLFKVKARFNPDPAPTTTDPSTQRPEDVPGPQTADSARRRKALQTRAGVAKLAAKNIAGGLAGLAATQSQRLVFDDAGTAHAPAVFADEAASAREASTRRAAFAAGEAERLAGADAQDRADERARRRAKKEKKRARERGEAAAPAATAGKDDDDGDGIGGLEVEREPLSLLGGLYSDDGDDDGDDDKGGDNEEDATVRPRKKAKKSKKDKKGSRTRRAGSDEDGAPLDDMDALEARARAVLA